MIWVALYWLLCAVVADIVISTVLKPQLEDAVKFGVQNPFTRSPRTAIITEFLLVMLLAPVFLVIVFCPALREHFYTASERIVLEDDEFYG